MLFCTSLYSSDIEFVKKSFNQLNEELTKEQLKKEKYIMGLHKRTLYSIERDMQDVYQEKDLRFDILENLLKIHNKTNSIVISTLLINKTLEYTSIKNQTTLLHYIKPASDFLYKNKFCDGYLFKGIFLENYKNDRKGAINIYQEGIKECSLSKSKWKHLELQSRLNVARHKKMK